MNASFLVDHIDRINVEDLAPTPDFLNQIERKLLFNNKLGQGAFGKLFGIKDNPALIVKIYDPCQINLKLISEGLVHDNIHAVNCEAMHSKTEITYFPHENRTGIHMANFLMDGVIGSFLSQLEKYTPHYIRTVGLYYSKFYNTTYTIMERGDPNVIDKLNTRYDVFMLLFQITHALYIAQRMYRFTHYDLHVNNLVTVPADPSYTHYQYHYDDNGNIVTVYLPSPKFLVRIIDFGLSRLETDNILLHPRDDGYPIKTSGSFDPNYDLAILLGPYLFDYDNPLGRKIVEHINIEDLSIFLSLILGESISKDEPYDKFIPRIYRTYYSRIRPLTSKIKKNIDFPRLFGWLGAVLNLSTNLSTKNNNIYITLPIMQSLPLQLLRTEYKHNLTISIDTGITYKSDSKQYPKHAYNHTLKHSNKISLIYIVTIDPNLAINYEFRSVCCKMEPMDYLNDKFGVAINGTFFDIGKSYNVIGPYRQLNSVSNRYYESNMEINNLYRQYFAFVVINNGNINIHRVDSIDPRTIDTSFMGGPLLIWNGQPQFSKEMLDTIINIDGHPTKIFQCQLPDSSHKQATLLKLDQIYTFNCNTIKPGELSHGSNPNPRSLLIITHTGLIRFVVVEGRTTSSDGLDLYDLVLLAQSMDAKHAINLDGGLSSNISWRSPLNPSTIGTLTRKYTYPVGNIIAYVRKQ